MLARYTPEHAFVRQIIQPIPELASALTAMLREETPYKDVTQQDFENALAGFKH